jgi:hypothetical protein
MRRFILGWKVLGHERRLDAHIVNYADDFVICCRDTADQALTAMRAMIDRLRLTVNEAKTRLCRGPDEPFDFLGYTVGRCYSAQTGRAYIGVRPSAAKLQGLTRKLSELTDRRWRGLDPEELVARLNPLLRGWGNYFRLGTIAAAYRKVNAHACARLRQWLERKSPDQGSRWTRYPDEYLYGTLGLLRLRRPPPAPS